MKQCPSNLITVSVYLLYFKKNIFLIHLNIYNIDIINFSMADLPIYSIYVVLNYTPINRKKSSVNCNLNVEENEFI